MEVRELSVGAQVERALLVRGARTRHRSESGELVLLLTLADRSGTVDAVLPAPGDAALEAGRVGEVVHVRGVVVEHERYGTQLQLAALRAAAPDEYQLDELLDGPVRPIALLERDLRELLSTIQRPCLRELLAGVFGEDRALWARFRVAPAAKRYHQAYRGGLLEHSVTVAQAVSAISATFPGIDRDLAVAGALVHDIGKLDAYEMRGESIEMSDDGRLFGEIPLGYHRIRTAIEAIPDFPRDVSDALLHIILSHHGSLEHGSPVVPATREATLVHGVDQLGARLGSFDRVEKTLGEGERWSGYDRAIGGGAYFPPAPRPPEASAAPAARPESMPLTGTERAA